MDEDKLLPASAAWEQSARAAKRTIKPVYLKQFCTNLGHCQVRKGHERIWQCSWTINTFTWKISAGIIRSAIILLWSDSLGLAAHTADTEQAANKEKP